jgi:hypothetical protein
MNSSPTSITKPVTNTPVTNTPVTHTQVKQHDNVGTTRPICRDYLKGKCYKAFCKFNHTPTVLTQSNVFPEPQSISKQEPKNSMNIPLAYLNTLYLPSKGHIILNISNFAMQEYYNGLFICNLMDVIPVEFIENLYNFGGYMPKNMAYDIIHGFITRSFKPEWLTKIKEIIAWTTHNSPDFIKNNYSLIFVMDISYMVRKWLFKHGTVKKNNKDILESLLYYMNSIFTHIISSMTSYEANKINVIIEYLNDELGIRTRGFIELIYNLITGVPSKYISGTFRNNIYYIGIQPDLTQSIGSTPNDGFTFCSINSAKYLNLDRIYLNEYDSVDEKAIDIQTNTDIITFNSQLIAHNSSIYNSLFLKNQEIKSALTASVPISNIRDKKLIIIGTNLDIEFDKDIISGLKEILGSMDLTGTHTKINNKKIFDAGKQVVNKKQDTSIGGNCCTNDGCDDSPSSDTTISFILPLFPQSSNQELQGQSKLNNMLQKLMHNIKPSVAHKPATNMNLIHKQICTIGLNLVTTYNNKLTTIQPFDTIPGVEKIKEYGKSPQNRIILLCSPKMTYEFFKEFITQITNNPAYTNRISANFINYDINPSIRTCLAYNNYRTLAQNYLQMPFIGEVPIIQMCKLGTRFYSFIKIFHPEYNKLDILSQVTQIPDGTHNLMITNTNTNTNTNRNINTNTNTNTNRNINTNTNTNANTNKCCMCCSCLSRNDIGYSKFGHLPYIPLELLKNIKDDSWLPRF